MPDRAVRELLKTSGTTGINRSDAHSATREVVFRVATFAPTAPTAPRGWWVLVSTTCALTIDRAWDWLSDGLGGELK